MEIESTNRPNPVTPASVTPRIESAAEREPDGDADNRNRAASSRASEANRLKPDWLGTRIDTQA